MLKIENTLEEICKGKSKVPKVVRSDLDKIKQIDAKLEGKAAFVRHLLDLKQTVEKATKSYFSKLRNPKVTAKPRVTQQEMKKAIDLVRQNYGEMQRQ